MSMTGFGRAQRLLHGRDITAEIRSVNNRYLECGVKLPRVYGFAEEPIKQEIKKTVSRGKLDVYFSVTTIEDSSVTISLNRPVLEGYLRVLGEITKEYGLRDDVSTMAVTKFPDIFVVEKKEENQEELTRDLLTVLADALESFHSMRNREGQTLAADLNERAATVLALTAKIEARSPQTVIAYRERLEAKMREILASTNIDENRILTEAAVYADKVAVDEETVRLRSHVAQMRELLAGGGSVGRKLDFLVQEMNREANTIGSKCSDLELTRIVVEIKAELEKIREQIQNLE